MGNEKFEKKMKHLEFVQGVITRMNSNSFSMKGWMITVVAAFFAIFASSKNMNKLYLFIAVIPTFLFWLLDTYYLHMERKYRKLFVDVRDDIKTNFEMDANDYDICFVGVMFSKTEWPLYLLMILLLVLGGLLGCYGIY